MPYPQNKKKKFGRVLLLQQFVVQGLIFIVDQLLAGRELLCDFIYITFIMEQMLTMCFYLLNLYHDSIQDMGSFKW